ncbi:hypothetical protein BJV82DRAFT_662523 [Fennellomyces sp. T-0311]|nr:hypothetical protein BJV82DRAFT_662523 [Fennellomyces sp. T-0311]
MTLNSPVEIVQEWSRAIQRVDTTRIRHLLHANPDLLWTPLIWDPDRDASHVISQLFVLRNLGASLENLCAIPYTLIQYYESGEKDPAQVHTAELLNFLIDRSSVSDLDHRGWGAYHNLTLHLVSFLGHTRIAQRLIVDKGVSVDIPNDIGYLPRDVAQTKTMSELLAPTKTDPKQKAAVRPKYASADRFKQLRQLAESSSNTRNNNSTRNAEDRYFRTGHVAESKQKVLKDEEKELEKHRAKRREDIANLAKRSAVKNNPLFKRFEQEQGVKTRRSTVSVKPGDNNGSVTTSVKTSTSTQRASTQQASTRQTPSQQTSTQQTTAQQESLSEEPETLEEEASETKKKRNSKVISSLRSKTYVSSSVFREDPPISKPSPSASSSSMDRTNSSTSADTIDIHIQEFKDIPTSPIDEFNKQDRRSLTVNEIRVAQDQPEAESFDRRRLSGSQKAHWSIALNSWSSVLENTEERAEPAEDAESEYISDDDEQWFDSQEDAIQELKAKKSKASLRSASSSSKAIDPPASDMNYFVSEQNNIPPQQPKVDNASSVHIVSRNVLGNYSSSPTILTDNSSGSTSSSSVSSPATISPSSPTTLPLASISEKKDNDSSLFDDEHDHQYKSYGSVAVRSTSRYVRRLSQAQNAFLKKQQEQLEKEKKDNETVSKLMYHSNNSSQQFKVKRVPVKLPASEAKAEEPVMHDNKKYPGLQELQSTLPLSKQPSSRYGKLYFRVNAISNVLLPLPREPTYVRCVVSDDRYEYMSRYEMLSQHIKFNYECIIDTHPDMIVNISLHVRPDYHVRNKLPLTRLFTSSRNRSHKGSLSSYIYHEDGSLGRTRFAMAHMMPSCYERPYATQFDCFNAWSPRDSHHKTKHRGEDDALKVIGNLEIEMLYLPVSDPAAPVPRNLRDCDMAIKVQQWNETFWNTEQLSNSKTSPSSPANGSSRFSSLLKS